jgi:hypothetical protein
VDHSTAITTSHRKDYFFGHSLTTTIPGELLRHSWNFIIVEPFSSPILFTAGIYFPRVLLHNQGYPKVCPDSPNPPNAGDPFCRNIVVIFLFTVFPYQGLNGFVLEVLGCSL